MKIRYFFFFLVIGTCFSYGQSAKCKKFTFLHNGGYGTSGTTATYSWEKYFHQGFGMKMWIANTMTIGCQAVGGNCGGIGPDGQTLFGLEYPVGSGIEHLFGAGPWIGGKINGVRHVDEGYNGDDARTEFIPNLQDTSRDRMWLTSTSDQSAQGYYKTPMNRKGYDDDHDGKIDEDDLDGLDNDGDWNPLTDDIGADGIPDSEEVGCKGVYDPIKNPDPAYDNYSTSKTKFDSCHPDIHGIYPLMNDRNKYTEKNGIPDHGEPRVDEDYGAVSDQDVYCAATDTFKLPVITDHYPMGIKAFMKSYAWRDSGASTILPIEYDFVNVGRKAVTDVFVAFFADMDVGPYNVSNYPIHNYAAYDSSLRVGYIQNPIGPGSTPLGVTVLHASRPLDSLQYVWQWHGYTDPGTIDALIYARMAWEGYDTSMRIKPSQSPANLGDTRFYFSIGPFDALLPRSPQNPGGDTLKVTFAFVSGSSISDMLNNARRAHRLYESGYFSMPVLQVDNPGEGKPTIVSWNQIERSPYGLVTSYRVLYGTRSGVYTDSVTTDSLSASIPGLTAGATYYFVVAAFDDHGNRGALSDEVTNGPRLPRDLVVTNGQTLINLKWTANTDLDLAGYNVYRHTSKDTTVVKLNQSLLLQPAYIDTAVRGDRTYYYKITAVDKEHHESPSTEGVSGRLIPPAMPAHFVIGPGKDYMHLAWSPNTEGDFAGYNIYRRKASDSVFTKVNLALWEKPDLIDSTIQKDTIYYYYVEAMDTTLATSQPTAMLEGHTVVKDRGILVVSAQGSIYADSSLAFCEWLLSGYRETVVRLFSFGGRLTIPSGVYDISPFSTLFYSQENLLLWPESQAEAIALKGYLLGGGNLLVMGRQLPILFPQYWLPILSEFFGVDYLAGTSPTWNFAGATGMQGFPSVTLDQAKLTTVGGRLNYVERFPNAQPQQVVYKFHSAPFDSTMDGQPVGLKALDSTLHAYYFSFPLYYLDSASAKAMLVKVLSDFGEFPTGISTESRQLPYEFHLYQSYPNPFNPTTKIRFDVPATSDVSLIVYDVLGREVARLAEGRKPPGSYEIEWDASRCASGVYFYRMRAGTFGDLKKMLLIR